MSVCAPLPIWSTRRLSKALARSKRTVTCPPTERAVRFSILGSAARTEPASSRVRMERAKRRTVWPFYHSRSAAVSAAVGGRLAGDNTKRPGEDARSLRARMPALLRFGVSEHAARRQFFVLLGGGLEDLLHEAGVERVAGLRGADLADDRAADEREIAQQIEDLVADELVAEAEVAADHAFVVEHDAVLDRAAAGEAGSAHLLDIAQEAKRAGRRDFLEETVVVEVELQRLPSDDRVAEIDLVLEDQAIRRRDADALLALDDLDRLLDPEDRDLGAEGADAGGVDEMHERQRAAVDDRDFRTVDLDVDVGDAAGHDRREEMLDGADRDVVFADGGRVVEGGGGCLEGGDAEAVEVGADEGDATAGGSGMQRDAGVDAGVKSDAGDADGRVDCFALYVHVRSGIRAREVPRSRAARYWS